MSTKTPVRNRYAAAHIAAKITGVPVKDILSCWRKGANPQGKEKYAVIVANQLMYGTFKPRDTANVAGAPADAENA